MRSASLGIAYTFKTKNGHEPLNDDEAFSDEVVIQAECLLEDVWDQMVREHARPVGLQKFVVEVTLPWDRHFPDQC